MYLVLTLVQTLVPTLNPSLDPSANPSPKPNPTPNYHGSAGTGRGVAARAAEVRLFNIQPSP